MDHNVMFITMDSCRWDTFERADAPFLKSLGTFRPAHVHGTYTVPAHAAFFTGHLPVDMSQTESQLWRIKTGRSTDRNVNAYELSGNTIFAGYRALGYFVLGVGGVTQFANNSALRSLVGEEFLYFGSALDEEPMQSRPQTQFPLEHIPEITERIQNHEKWFLFINCPETHYPYDSGDGLSKTAIEYLHQIKPHLNLRESKLPIDSEAGRILHELQISALEKLDDRIQKLFTALPRNRPILFVICADHGENFGEIFAGRSRWGHLLPTTEVLTVPLLITRI